MMAYCINCNITRSTQTWTSVSLPHHMHLRGYFRKKERRKKKKKKNNCCGFLIINCTSRIMFSFTFTFPNGETSCWRAEILSLTFSFFSCYQESQRCEIMQNVKIVNFHEEVKTEQIYETKFYHPSKGIK